MGSVADCIQALRGGDRVAAERASRSLRKLAEDDPASMSRWRGHLLELAIEAEDLRVRWNLVQILGKLQLTSTQQAAAVDWLFERLADASPLTRTFGLQALVDLSAGDPTLRTRLLPIAREFAENGTAAMRARARKLLKQLS